MDTGESFEAIYTVFGVLVLLAVVAIAVFISKRSTSIAQSGSGPFADAARALNDALTQRLGYVSVSPVSPTPQYGTAAQPARTEYVRTVGARTLRWSSETQLRATSMEVSMQWRLELAQPARVPLHLLSSHLGGLASAAADALMRRSRTVKPAYPSAVPVASGPLAGRLLAYTAPGFEAAAAALLNDAELGAILSQLSLVDLRIEPNAVRFDDPFQENLTALMGGPMGMMNAFTPSGIERTVWLHDALARALTRVADLGA